MHLIFLYFYLNFYQISQLIKLLSQLIENISNYVGLINIFFCQNKNKQQLNNPRCKLQL
ncbi:hypothetical protein TTHERM_000088099 (macronuclear) [Tetrahymena thermophila SB210]|uniref:Uncharacterized protein n=1 Tax=Tetrahymena thermophila (strain SB210) TaxID=312017 RepID=W7XJ50_TETTS|nr:hypothetical protein TTHERM_000088099 [Tetrahymena thermophila SB210]EWS75211.1 hypothetical protein TTHERM_000088099 [Tetrahymena thermophila SB210]|eukprot:XP_012652202.1 hypothetical protein TTHERM_000088099 [Tetrahymena thermophila SB210]